MKNTAPAGKNEHLKSRFRELRTFLEKIWKSPCSDFYRQKYEAAGLSLSNIKTWQDWRKIPFLTREDLSKTGPWQRLYVPREKLIATRNTSGTTGGGMVLMLRSEDVDTWKYLSDFHFKSLLSLTSYHRFYTMVRGLSNVGVSVCAGDIHDMPRTAKMAKTLKIDSLLGAGSMILLFGSHLKRPVSLENIRFIMLVGEYTTRLQWENLKKLYPNADIVSIYGSVENGFKEIDSPCRENAKIHNRHHLIEKSAFMEIDENGEIILTTFSDATPLIRYKTGDLGAFINGRCACGSDAPIFSVSGRVNFDAARLKGTEIKADEVERAIYDVLKIERPEFKLHIYEKSDLVPRLVLEIVSIRKPEKFEKMANAAIGRMIAGKIQVSSNLSLGQAIENGLFETLEIIFVSEFPLEQKQKRIILHEF